MTDIRSIYPTTNILERLPPEFKFCIYQYLNYRDVFGDLFRVYWNYLETNRIYIRTKSVYISYYEISTEYKRELKTVFFNDIPPVEMAGESGILTNEILGMLYDNLNHKKNAVALNRKYGVIVWNKNTYRHSEDPGTMIKHQLKVMIHYLCYYHLFKKL